MRLLTWTLVLAVAVLGACASSQGGDPDGGGDDDGGGDGGGDPIDAPIDAQEIDAVDAAVCSSTPCNILDQCGCEGSPNTPVCDLDFTMLTTGATKCRSRNTTVVGDETQTCTMASTCAPLHVCVGGRCRKYCDDDNDCAGPGGLCLIDLTQGNPPMPIPGAPTTCTTDCIPNQASNPTCPPTWACHIFFDDPTPGAPTSGDERYLSDCLAPGAGTTGAACTGSQQCAAGFDCVTLNPGGQQCRPNCNMATGACPAGSGSCRAFDPPVVIGAATYGVCF